jgi:hypothetical protein
VISLQIEATATSRNAGSGGYRPYPAADDFDGVLRHIPAVRPKDVYESLALATYRTYLDNEPAKIVVRDDEGDRIPKLKHVQIRSTIIPLDSSRCHAGAVHAPARCFATFPPLSCAASAR